jgi:transposase
MEVDGDNRMELLFTPSVDQAPHALFLRQIAETDLQARHIIIADQAGFHLKPDDARVPANMRLLPLPPYSPELNPVERLDDLVKDNICNQLFDKLPALERAILAELAPLRESGQRVEQLIGHGWLLDKVNSDAPI